MAKIAIVVPCYNEGARLDVRAFQSFRLDDHEVAFHFVNDGSRDDTLAVLERLQQASSTITVINLPFNQGKAEAVRQGVLAACARRPDFVGFLDADLATPLSEIAGFVDVLRTRPETEIVLGARVRLLGRDINRRAVRHYVGRIGATLIAITLGITVYDTQCGAKLFRATPRMCQLFKQRFLSRWLFDVEIIARLVERDGAAAAAAAIYELPLRAWHHVPGSKVKTSDFIRSLSDLWRIRKAYRLRGPAPR
jgi:dolichyl-phosphate beta-glucosyltransferase